ncbi:hypothetical protein LNK82_38890 [Saccharothrix sp. NEAU-S10]|nr:oligopeptide/dipeptide ABC transporter ATP-binding protein [Saccharothrix luteola]MCC8250255.1 hypothetical protein [Saccharothrix luteola]
MYAGRVVEGGDSETVTQRPAHPYTQLLIDSAPDPDRPAAQEKDGGTGEPPSLINPPDGCRFNPRCPFAMEVCARKVPPRFAIGDGSVEGDSGAHFAACWLYGDLSDDDKVKLRGVEGAS